MAPLPQEPVGQAQADNHGIPVPDDGAVVISGISGLLPECDSYAEFADKLFENKNLVTGSPRWKDFKYPELPEQYGKITGLNKFDAQFFTVFYSLAQSVDPLARKIFEQTYQAIFDSGICPIELWGKHVAVFMSYGFCETEKLNASHDSQLGIVGACKAMTANRVSYWLNLQGPSVYMDGSSCGSLLALEKAREAIIDGRCESAIVGCGKVILHPQVPISHRMMPLNFDGKTKCYDEAADGPSMSEAAVVFFLQKYKDAKRSYAVLRHLKTHFGASNDQIYECQIPQDTKVLTNFFRDFYDEAEVAPADVEYIEGYGAGFPEMDKVELEAIENIFCKDRTKPLLLGSVSSNVGYTESATSACAILKIISAYQRGEIPATINCVNPRRDIAALQDGRMHIVTKNTAFNRKYTAVSAFSYTGLNAHGVLECCYKPKDLSKYRSDIPYLVTVSGRQESAVQKILDDIKSRPLDPEEIALIHIIHRNRISKHLARGYGVYSSIDNTTVTLNEKVDYHDDVSRPLWFVYSGMGSQWIGMGRELMRIPTFNKAIQRCHKILESKGVDLINVITTSDKHIFDNILHSFVGIAAIQIGLTDVLTSIGLVPDKIIGHSLGELGCAYADGCFTAEQTILLAYNRGLVSIQTPFIFGSMAAVGMGYKTISKICPSDIEIACRNSTDSSTISGPAKSVKSFVDMLTKQGIFAKEVQCSNIPYHSRYIADAGPDFLKLSKQVVKEPKMRSDKWLSSSVPQEEWAEPYALYSSAEYHTNNLLNKVLFEEVLRLVPSNAVLVEIAPHGLLQAILKRALSVNCQHVPLTRRGEQDSAVFFLKALGNLYMEGFEADISALYPKVEFPVSTETRSLSHLVEWAHGEKWNLCEYISKDRFNCSVLNLFVAVEDDEYKYLDGHQVDGLRLFPYAAALVSVWDTMAITAGHKKREVSIQFSDVKFHSQPPVYDQKVLHLTTMVQRGSGRFEVIHGKEVVIEGYAVIVAGRGFGTAPVSKQDHTESSHALNKEDIYKIFYENGYQYKDDFRSVKSVNDSMNQAQVEWHDNWVTFIDGVLQTCTLRSFENKTSFDFNFIRKIIVDVKVHINESLICKDNQFSCGYDEVYDRTRCGGLTIEHTFYKSKPHPVQQSVTLLSQKFQPFFQNKTNDVTTSIFILLQILADNLNKANLTIYNVNVPNKRDFENKLKSIAEKLPMIKVNIISYEMEKLVEFTNINKPDAIVVHDLLSDKKVLESLYKISPSHTFLISIGVETKNVYPIAVYAPISSFGSGHNKVELAVLKPNPKPSNTTAVSVRNNSDIHQINSICMDFNQRHKLLVLSSYPAPSAVKDMLKYWRDHSKNLSLVMFDQKDTLHKELENIPDVPICALQNGMWGNDYFVPTKCEGNGTKTCTLKCTQIGNVNSLKWVEVQETRSTGIEVTVQYAGLSVKDAKMATVETQNISSNDGFGMDFSGFTARGDRVMGLVAGGSASTKVKAQPELLWPVPDHWSLEDAATVPLAYAHAFYCLRIKFDLRKGMTVLVHGGAGALGQATISIALAYGCRVFTTVSDLSKKRFLKKLFPELPDDHIGNSRSGSFADMVKKHMKRDSEDGGCDLVIGYTKGELKNLSLSCCGVSGYTLDVAQLVEQEHFQFGLSHLFCCRTYSLVDLSSIFRENNTTDMMKLQVLMSDGIRRGFVRPLTRVTYEPHETPRAFRLLAGSRHRGRVLLALHRDILAKQSLKCTPDRNHLVVCDDEGFGLQFVDTLVERGATRIHIHCQKTPYVKHKVENWDRKGVQVEVSFESINSKDGVHHLLSDCSRLGDVEGVYVITTNAEQKQEMSATVAYLDEATRKFCPGLRYFAVISENCEPWKETIVDRAKDGLPSLSLQLLHRHQYGAKTPPADKSVELQWRCAVEAIETALTSRDSVVLAYAQPTTTLNILKEVAKIPGVNITNATVGRTTLEQVGLDQDRAPELCYVLQQKFNITISKELVPRMTIAQLEKLHKPHVDIERDVDGFAAYFTYFDPDAMQASSDLVIMPTLVHRSRLRADEFDVDRDYLCVVPGLEGHYGRFGTLCQRLKIPTVVLHPDPADETLEEMAQKIASTILRKLNPKKSFYLLGYEFGVLVALEIASILERKGLTGTVYMLGGTPLDICNSFNNRWKDISPKTQQDALISHMYSLVAGNNSIELEKKLQTLENWSDKVDCFAKKISYSIQYTRGFLQGAYTRIKLLQNYDFRKYKLNSKLILIRAKLPTNQLDTLQDFPEGMQVHNIKASLAHAAKDLTCSNIINKYLDKQILEDYENSNHCETCLRTEEFMKLHRTSD